MLKSKLLYCAGLVRFLGRSNIFFDKGKFKTSLAERIKMFFWGFYSDESKLYDFKKYNRKDFLSDFQMCCKAVQINTGYTEVLNNKLVFSRFIEGFMNIPRNYGYIYNNRIYFLEPDMEAESGLEHADNIGRLKFLLKENKSMMAKLFDAGSGKGIFKLEMKENEIFINNKKASDDEILEMIKKCHNYQLCEFINQAEYSKKIFARTCNTVKFLTMIDPDSGEAFLVRAFHRFGTEKSFPVDNLGHGSCLSNIDVETGIMGPTYTIKDNSLCWITTHPDTGEAIDGVAVTDFHKVAKDILNVHNKISYIKYIAWDVVLQDDGYIVLEGNANTDMAGIQPFEPILLNERVRRFYQYHKVVR